MSPEEYLEELKELKEFLDEHTQELYEDETKRCLYLYVTDLENYFKSLC